MRVFLFAFLAAVAIPAARSGEAVKVEAVLYLFKTSAVTRMDFSQALKGRAPLSGNGLVFTPPARLFFDDDELALGADYAWNGGGKVPSRFRENRLAAIITELDKPATIRIVAPVQYLEKMPDGTLKLRELAGDVPDIPHYALTVLAKAAPGAPVDGDLVVTCRMDVATLRSREKIPGIDLEVGRPITAGFDQSVEYPAHRGQWSAVMGDENKSGEYVLLMLLKVGSPGDSAPAVAADNRPADPAKPDSVRLEAGGFAMAAPGGSNWQKKSAEGSQVFLKRVSAMTYYQAGFSALQRPEVRDRQALLEFARFMLRSGPDTSFFMTANDVVTEREANGLWVIECNRLLETWGGAGWEVHDPLAARTRLVYAMDPRRPGEIAVAWFGWRGYRFDQEKFTAEAGQFLGSLQVAR